MQAAPAGAKFSAMLAAAILLQRMRGLACVLFCTVCLLRMDVQVL
jgi:hypothetical protein